MREERTYFSEKSNDMSNREACVVVSQSMAIPVTNENFLPNECELQHQNSIKRKKIIEPYNGEINEPCTIDSVTIAIPADFDPKQCLGDVKNFEKTNDNEKGSSTAEICRERVSLALYAYFHHKYYMFVPSGSDSISAITYSFAEDIRLASCMPNRLQESFPDRLGFLFDEHGYLVTQDALLRPADATDEKWQEMLQQRLNSEKIKGALQLSEDVERVFDVDITDEEARKEEEDGDKEDDEKSLKATLAQGAGAYVFTKIVPLALGLSMSVPMVLITACVGVVAGQVAWDSYQQQNLLYPSRYYSSRRNNNMKVNMEQIKIMNCDETKAVTSEEQLFSLILSQATSSSNKNNLHQQPLSLEPPKRLSLLRLWWKDMYIALAHSNVGITLEENAVTLFTSHWLQSLSTYRGFDKQESDDKMLSQSFNNFSNKDSIGELDDEWEIVETIK